MKAEYTIMDLFCGTGGFAQGFVSYDDKYRVVYGIDKDPYAAATAKANHPHSYVEKNDIRAVTPKQVARRIKREQVDVIIGGPPCQGFSSLRPYRSASSEDKRNDLYMAFASFVDFFKPKVVVMENVVGLITHKSGHSLENTIESFRNLGYNTDWRVLNAAAYGVPQKRERFIMIAARDNGEILFPPTTHYFNGKVIGYRDKNRHVPVDPSNPDPLTVNDAISDLPSLNRGEQVREYNQEPITHYQEEMRAGATDLTLHKAANHSDKMLEVIKHAGENIHSIPKHLITSGFSSCYSRLDGDKPSTTITVKFQSPASNKCIHPTQNRTITPREAARIQSFSDVFIFEGPLTQVARQIGNAVPPLLGKAIASSVSELLKKK